MMKYLFYFLSFSCVALYSCSEKNLGIYKTASFYKVNTPGTIAVDEKGNEITPRRDTTREIYFVTKKAEAPKIISVVINHHYYTPVITKIDSNKIYVGERLPNNEKVELNVPEDVFFWKVTVGKPIPDLIINDHPSPPQLYFEIKHKGKNKIYEIKSSSELVPELRY